MNYDAIYWGATVVITAVIIFVLVTIMGRPIGDVTLVVSVGGVLSALGTTALIQMQERGA